MALAETITARAARDVIRNALINELRRCEIPERVRELLDADERATEEFHRAWAEYQTEQATEVV